MDCMGCGVLSIMGFIEGFVQKGYLFQVGGRRKNPLDHDMYGYFLKVLQMLVTLSSVSFPLSINCCICFLFSTSYKHKNKQFVSSE